MKNIIIDELSFGKKTLFTHHEILIHKTGIHVISGKNGSGKTSLAKAIMERYHDEVTLMTQENNIVTEISILHNVCMNVVDESVAVEYMSRYNLSFLLEKDPRKLSGGEKRLILLIRAILSPRNILILDEPSNDIDIINIKVVSKIIQDQKMDKCILLITHDKRMEDLADYFYLIKDKKLNQKVEYLDKEDNLSSEGKNMKFRSFYNLKFQYQNKILVFISVFFLLWSLFDFSLLSFDKRFQDNHIYISTWFSRYSDDILSERGMDIADLLCAIKSSKLTCDKEMIIMLEEIEIDSFTESIYPFEFLFESELITYDSFFLQKLDIDSDRYDLGNFIERVVVVNDNNLFFDFSEELAQDAELFLSNHGFERVFDSRFPRFNISPLLYDLFINEYISEGEVVSAFVQKKESTDFFNWLENNDLYNKSAVILSNETDRIMLESKQANRMYQLVITQTTNIIVSFLLIIILTIVNEKKMQNIYISLYAYGYSNITIRKVAEKQYKSNFVNITVLSCVSIFTVYKFFELNSYIILLLIPLVYVYLKIINYVEAFVVYLSLRRRKL